MFSSSSSAHLQPPQWYTNSQGSSMESVPSQEKRAKLDCKICKSTKEVRIMDGVLCCCSCSNFFKRSSHRASSFECTFRSETCEINESSRKYCSYCRLKKCFNEGMTREDARTVDKRHGKPSIFGNPTTKAIGVCLICGDDDKVSISYGCLNCAACTHFFRRSFIQSHQPECIFKNNACKINKQNRQRCTRCRLDKCIRSGMKLRGSGNKIKQVEIKAYSSEVNTVDQSLRVYDAKLLAMHIPDSFVHYGAAISPPGNTTSRDSLPEPGPSSAIWSGLPSGMVQSTMVQNADNLNPRVVNNQQKTNLHLSSSLHIDPAFPSSVNTYSRDFSSPLRLHENSGALSQPDNFRQTCNVCESKKFIRRVYGVSSCDTCWRFFKFNSEKLAEFECSRKTRTCEMNESNRRGCKYCRLKKCLAVGMRKRCKLTSFTSQDINVTSTKLSDPNRNQEDPEDTRNDTPEHIGEESNVNNVQNTSIESVHPGALTRHTLNVCVICGDSSNVTDAYGCPTCAACTIFFERKRNKLTNTPECIFKSNTCQINKQNRSRCPRCRLQKCVRSGMKFIGRETNAKKMKMEQNPPGERNICRVCAGKTARRYYGVMTCDSCKLFYKKNHDKFSTIPCIRQTEQCKISSRIQPKCAKCRLQKCIDVGMNMDGQEAKVINVAVAEALNPDIESSSPSFEEEKICKVCENPALKEHYGIMSCEECRKFFKFNIGSRSKCKCPNKRTCEGKCIRCRVEKCLEMGMSLEAKSQSASPCTSSQAPGLLDKPSTSESTPIDQIFAQEMYQIQRDYNITGNDGIAINDFNSQTDHFSLIDDILYDPSPETEKEMSTVTTELSSRDETAVEDNEEDSHGGEIDDKSGQANLVFESGLGVEQETELGGSLDSNVPPTTDVEHSETSDQVSGASPTLPMKQNVTQEMIDSKERRAKSRTQKTVLDIHNSYSYMFC